LASFQHGFVLAKKKIVHHRPTPRRKDAKKGLFLPEKKHKAKKYFVLLNNGFLRVLALDVFLFPEHYQLFL